MTSIADILRGTLVLITLLGIVNLDSMPSALRRGKSIVTLSQIFLSAIYVLVDATDHSHTPAIMPTSWVLLWILSTLDERDPAGRLGQLAGLATLFSRHPAEMAFFAGITYLLTAPTDKLRRFSPRALSAISALLISSDPFSVTLPPSIAVAAGLAALVGFAAAPVIGFALSVYLLPETLPEPYVTILFIAAAIFLWSEKDGFGTRAWPLMMLGLVLKARHDHLDDVATYAALAFLMGMIILPAHSTQRSMPSALLSLPIPPMPMFIASAYSALAISLFAMKLPQFALSLLLPTLIFGIAVARLLITPWLNSSQKEEHHDRHTHLIVLCLVTILIPGACLGLVANALFIPANPLRDHPLLHRLFALDYNGTLIWWSPIAIGLLLTAFLLRRLTKEERQLIQYVHFTGNLIPTIKTNRSLLRSILQYRKFFRSITIDSIQFINKRVAQDDYLVKIIFFLVILGLIVVGFRGAFSWP